jgi:hypothetical protein
MDVQLRSYMHVCYTNGRDPGFYHVPLKHCKTCECTTVWCLPPDFMMYESLLVNFARSVAGVPCIYVCMCIIPDAVLCELESMSFLYDSWPVRYEELERIFGRHAKG